MALTKISGSILKDPLNLGGEVSIGGTLTYQDVTNVDAIGIITARAGVNVSGGQLDVGSNIKLGNAGVITATSFVGSGSGLTGLPAGTTINNNTDNYVITATGTANTLRGESGVIITSDSELIVGMSAGAGATPDARLQVRGDSHTKSKIQVFATHNDDNPATLQISKSRSGGNTILGDNDDIGQINFASNDGNGFHNVGRIMVSHDGSGNGNDDLPSMMRFFTTANAGVSLAERLRITSEGYLKIVDNGTQQTNTTLSYQHEGAFLTHYVARTTAGGDRYRRMFDIASVGANPHGSSIRLLTSPDATNPAVTVERVRIDHNGRVGINKTTPRAMLSVKAERSAVPRFGIDGHYSDSSYTQCSWDDSNGLYTLLGVNHELDANGNDTTPVASLHSASMFLDGRGGNIRFYVKPNSGTTFTEAMRIHDNGAVSVGGAIGRNYYGALNAEKTSSSNSAIDIKASGSGSYAQAISFGDHNTISGELKIKNSTDITLGTSSNHPFVLLGNNVAGLKISNSNGRLERNFGAGSGHTADGMWFNNSVTTTGYFVRFWQTSGGYGANQIGSITHGANNTAYNTSSDYRLKENAVGISDGIARLKLLKPYRFNFKTEPSKTVDGFFAHEAATVVPEAVTGTKDEVADSDSPDIGQKAGDPVYQGIDQAKLIPLLTAALQEAVARIEALESS